MSQLARHPSRDDVPRGWVILLIGLLMVLYLACSKESPNSPPPTTQEADCVGCHTNKDLLVATAEEDTSSGSEGPAGET